MSGGADGVDAPTTGQMVDALGVTVSLGEGQMVTDAVLLVKVLGPDGNTWMQRSCSEGMSWIERLGMLDLAHSDELHRINDARGDS